MAKIAATVQDMVEELLVELPRAIVHQQLKHQQELVEFLVMAPIQVMMVVQVEVVGTEEVQMAVHKQYQLPTMALIQVADVVDPVMYTLLLPLLTILQVVY